ncbi:penicillin-binding protein 2 [candidate division WOR-1 bacterium RIFCSPHIGHO2_01_FULL_53_15]|uniref:Penicillin-binding protein 2 n=1 Tax=candidate division WOR-1 bacterium RIFCSPHIGHO2_01_FULL_53_15 TaxID=1802564 RepID=A0A1F4PYU9_UNCSA|nr:MAG: penicillin-binding protein 2 [candidate division WOR-1 bacterium RIFCSPHIGHO2_01_FULL_53_15]OGC10693.1 MAG: penicillin-binding protein 2 [candidate division WOR-1 bacterium RIFCSPHIGHO2_02_FULL_53_26]
MNSKNNVLAAVIGAAFLILLLRLLQLQLAESGKYKKLSDENAAKTVYAPAPRGVIYDRNGKVMVGNRPIFSVQVLPELLTSADTAKRDRILKKLGELLGEKIEVKVSPGRPIIVRNNIPPAAAVRIEEQKSELEGVVVSVIPVRYYPFGGVAAHLLGYVGEIEAAELARLKSEGYRLGDSLGKDGVEKIYDRLIRGVDGGKKIEVDAFGTPTRLLKSTEPLPGADVKLTVDLDLQLAAEKALGGKEGAVVILDPRTGELLAMVSHPNFDPNLFIDPLDRSKWVSLNQRKHPFMNRALAIYPPGSIFKAVTLSAVLAEGLAKPDEVFNCPGYYKINNRYAACWKEGGHGRLTLAEGLTQSCDVVFYEMGRRLGPDRLAQYAGGYGLGGRTGLDLPQEKKGLVPTSAWKKNVRREIWYEGDSINYGIGQGFVQVTPLQMAAVYGTIATGKRMKPFVVREIRSRDGEELYRGEQAEVAPAPVSHDILTTIRDALKEVVARATGIAARVVGIPAAGKTGTAENPGLPHAWFLCYAPADDPQIVIASFVAHGEHGDRASAYVARDILTWYRDNRLTAEAFDSQ